MQYVEVKIREVNFARQFFKFFVKPGAILFCVCFFCLTSAKFISADSSGPNSPSTMADDATVGNTSWSSPDNAKLNDATYTTSSTSIAASPGSFGIKDSNIRIVKSDGTIGTANKALGTTWSSTEAYSSYGSSSDLWGETWTPADINNSNFGIVVGAIADSSGGETHYLKATNFGFSIPSDATVDGILAEVKKKSSTAACILPGSYVQTPEGGKKIEDIKTGDKVFSFNQNENKMEEDTVTETFAYNKESRSIYYIYVDELTEPLKVTGDHQIYSKSGYKPAESIRVGDVLLDFQFGDRVVTKIYKELTDSRVFNLEIENNHNFFVNNILVHNPLPQTYWWAKIDHILITVYYTPSNTAPILTSVATSPNPIKGGSTITITPTGQGSRVGSSIYYYCNETGSVTSSNTLCSQANASYSSPYTTATCTYAVTTGDATRTVYCRTYDGSLYSTEQTTTYLVDTTAPTTTATAVRSSWPGSYTFGTESPTAVTTSLSCSDGTGSGCSTTVYCTEPVINTGQAPTCTPTTTYTTGVTIEPSTGSSTTYIRYSSTDAVSNSEATNSQAIIINDPTGGVVYTPTPQEQPQTDVAEISDTTNQPDMQSLLNYLGQILNQVNRGISNLPVNPINRQPLLQVYQSIMGLVRDILVSISK